MPVTSRKTLPLTLSDENARSASLRRDVAARALRADLAGVVADRQLAAHGVERQVAARAVDDEVATHRAEAGVAAHAGDEGGGTDDAELDPDAAGHHDADVGAVLARPRAEHVEPVVPAELGVVDLDRVAVDAHEERLAGDRVHFDPHAGLVVGDDVDLPSDEADLEGARHCRCRSSWGRRRAISPGPSRPPSMRCCSIRDISRVSKSRYIACGDRASPGRGGTSSATGCRYGDRASPGRRGRELGHWAPFSHCASALGQRSRLTLT